MTLAKVLISLTARNGSDSFPNSKINSFLLTNRAMSNLNVASSFAHFFNRFIGQYRSTNIQITFQKFPSSTSMARSAHTKAELRKPEATDNSFLSFSIKSQVKSFYDNIVGQRWWLFVFIIWPVCESVYVGLRLIFLDLVFTHYLHTSPN